MAGKIKLDGTQFLEKVNNEFKITNSELKLKSTGNTIVDSSGNAVVSESGGNVTLTADEANVGSNALVVDSSGNVVINESGADVDFRVKSITSSAALFVEGSSGNVGVGLGAPQEKLQVLGNIHALGSGSGNGTYGPYIAIGKANGPKISSTQENADDDIQGLAFFTKSSATGSNPPFEAMRINSSGKILASAGSNWAGTVSQTGQSSIIERDSNNNGFYLKFADGTLICWHHAATEYLFADGTGLKTATWTYPHAFSLTPRFVGLQVAPAASSDADNFTYSRPQRFSSRSSTQVTIWTYINQSVSSTVYVEGYAIGQWY